MDSSYLVQAIVECEQTLKPKSNNQEQWQSAFKNLGNLLQGIGEFDRAIVWHSLALEREANLAEVYCQLGELYILEKNWPAALVSFESALEYMPQSDRIYSSLAHINGHLQRKDAEMDCWYRATELNPYLVNSSGYHKLAKALEQRGKIAEAIACYEKAAMGEGASINVFYDLGEIYLRQHQLDRAEVIYEKILLADPSEARALYKLGTIYLQKQRFNEAIESFRQTIQNAPDFPWAYRDLVKTFLILQKWDEAISTCYAILNLVEEYPWVYGHLGDALREKGKLNEAAVNFQKACNHRGWNECIDHSYFFTSDIFSYLIPIWEENLKPLIAAPKNDALQVGCYQGMSCCWILDKILGGETDTLTCIDKDFEAHFKSNIIKTGKESQVSFLAGNIHQLMANLTPQSFDLINLRERPKLAKHIEKSTQIAWKLLRPGGFLIFNFYGWRHPTDKQKNPQKVIDQFLESIPDQWQRVCLSPQAYQLIIRKLG